MYKKLLICFILMLGGFAYAEPVEITPAQEISTAKKDFKVGNRYLFKDIKSSKLYSGEVTYYRPNGTAGQEAQVEFSNFTDSKGCPILGKITIIPSNHKNFQEYTNYFDGAAIVWIRGSEVILKKEKQTFLINYNNENSVTYSIKLLPAGIISTAYDGIECGDVIKFKNAYDVYKNGKLLIKSGTLVYGKVDYIDENGWCFDNAVIYIKSFKTTTADGNDLFISSNLKIDGFELLQHKSKRLAQFFNYLSCPFRGKEIDIKPYDKNVSFMITVEK